MKKLHGQISKSGNTILYAITLNRHTWILKENHTSLLYDWLLPRLTYIDYYTSLVSKSTLFQSLHCVTHRIIGRVGKSTSSGRSLEGAGITF